MSLKTSLRTEGTWDSNPLMATTNSDKKAIYGNVTTPQITFQDQTPRTALSLKTWLDENAYNDKDYNATEYHGSLELSRSNERWRAGLTSAVDDEILRQSEWTSLGLTSKNARALRYHFKPEISYQNSTTTRLGLSSDYTQLNADTDQTRSYENYSITPNIHKTMDELNTAFLSFYASRYQTVDDKPITRSDSIGPSVGWLRKLSQKLNLKLSGGVEYSKDQGYNISESNWKIFAVYSAALTYLGERDNVSLMAQRAKQPFDNGSEYYLTIFSLNLLRKLTPDLSLNLKGSYQFADYNVSRGDVFDYRLDGTAGFNYQIYRDLQFSLSYRRRQDVWTMGDTAKRDIGLVSFAYIP